MPGLRFAVWNPIHQTYSFYSPTVTNDELHFRQSQRGLKGFVARVWDHEVRHLDGVLAVAEEINHGEIYVTDDYRDNPGLHEMAELTKKQLKFMSHDSLKKLFKKPTR
jgi:hypothetical protein